MHKYLAKPASLSQSRIFFSALAFSFAAFATKATAQKLTFTQALQASQSQSIEFQRAQLLKELAEADNKILDYENDFKLSLGGGVSDYRPKTADSPSNSVSKDRVASLTLSKTLYDFGRHSAKMSQADLQTAIKNLSAEEVKESLTYRLGRIYGAVVAAQRAASITANQVRVSESRLAEQEKNYRAGLRSESDFIAAQVDLGKARLNQKRAEDDLQLARQNLAALMSGTTTPQAAVGEVDFPLDLANYAAATEKTVSTWNDFRPTAQQTRHERERESLAIDQDLVSLTKRPTIAGSLVAQKSGPWGTEMKDLYTAQLTFNWDIPWNGQGREELNRVAIRSKDLELQEKQEDKARRDRALIGAQSFSSALRQLQSIIEQQQLTEKLLNLVKQRYRTGKATSLEVSAVESDNLTNQLDQSKILSSLISAVLDIAEARGVSDIHSIFLGGM